MNFGSVYGQGAGGLVQSAWDQFDVVLDFDEAKAWLQTFADTYYDFTRWRSVHFRACERRRYIVIGKQARDGIGRIYPQSRVPESGSFYTRCCNCRFKAPAASALEELNRLGVNVSLDTVGRVHFNATRIPLRDARLMIENTPT